MPKKISIAIDAMGGDNSPDKTIEGVGIFLKKNITQNDYILNIFETIAIHISDPIIYFKIVTCSCIVAAHACK